MNSQMFKTAGILGLCNAGVNSENIQGEGLGI